MNASVPAAGICEYSFGVCVHISHMVYSYMSLHIDHTIFVRVLCVCACARVCLVPVQNVATSREKLPRT
jgi:hypothetical protein